MRRARLAVLLACVTAAAWSCTRTPPATVEPAAWLQGGKLVFQDDFNRDTLGPDWTSTSATWHLEAGRLADEGAKNEGAWLNRDLPANVRVEFTAWSLPPAQGQFRGDMKCEAFGHSRAHESGYSFVFGGWANSLSIIARQGEHAPDRKETPGQAVVADRPYKWAVVRQAGSLYWFLDGALYLTYEDANPVGGGAFGFNNWISRLRFDDFKVFAL
jgi:hypothetical protein